MSDPQIPRKHDLLTGRHRGEFATVGWVEDTTDQKLGAVIAHYLLPLAQRVKELEAQPKPEEPCQPTSSCAPPASGATS